MASAKAQGFNQRIGCCLQVILITWLLWQPIHCNRNRVNQLNRSTKSFEQRLNQNDFDPLPKPNASSKATGAQLQHNRPINSDSPNLDNFNLNYLLSVLQEEERQAIFKNIINHQKSDTSAEPTQTFVLPNREKEDLVANHDLVELGLDDKKDINEANKLSLFSSSLNVIDVEPQDTQLAHNVLVIHKPKPNKTAIKPSYGSPVLAQQSVHSVHSAHPNKVSNNRNPIVSAIISYGSKPSTTTEVYATPVRNNHRPSNNRPFMGIRAKPSTTQAPPIKVALITKTTPSITSIFSVNKTSDSQTMNTTFATTDELDEIPVIFNNNHNNNKHSYPMFTRQKLTSTEYALIFTSTPESLSDNDKTSFTEVPTVMSPSYTFRPPYVTTIHHQKRPPMKIMTVNANKVKQPEEIYSEGITVLDPPFISNHPMKLPPNTTIIHKNLIVPMKDGRPKPMFPSSSTTQYPVYPIVAGITNWHTSPTTPWLAPIVTTSAPGDFAQHIATTLADTSDSDVAVTAQSVNRPTIITGQPLSTGHSSQFVTVTPIKSSTSSSTNHFIVTSSQTPRPSTSTTGYVNAIWAPPMPVGRPVQAVQAPVGGGWWGNIFSVDPTTSGMFSFMSIMKTVLFTILVFFMPPLTLAAALMQTAVG